MGILEYFTGWKLVQEKELPEEILKKLQSKIDREMYKKVKEVEKKAYKKSKEIKKPLPNISGCTVYLESIKYDYKAIEPEWKWIQKEKPGFQSSSKPQYYQRLMKKK